MARNKMTVKPMFAESFLAANVREAMDECALDSLADDCDTSILETETFGQRLALAVENGDISPDAADAFRVAFGIPFVDSSADFDGSDALREYAAAVLVADSDTFGDCPESEIKAFLDLIAP